MVNGPTVHLAAPDDPGQLTDPCATLPESLWRDSGVLDAITIDSSRKPVPLSILIAVVEAPFLTSVRIDHDKLTIGAYGGPCIRGQRHVHDASWFSKLDTGVLNRVPKAVLPQFYSHQRSLVGHQINVRGVLGGIRPDPVRCFEESLQHLGAH